ncbi:MAG: hypothetical protein A49_14600 [Methyloceanibacter sp.]|nr:MAG: hypothetical protein A49_14600 [Methyloceanibacter sp.]
MTAGIVEYARQDCPICGHRGWCGVRDDGLVLCKRPPTPREVPGFAFRGMAKDSATAMYVESGREFNNGHVKRSTPRTNTPGPSDAPREKRVTPEWLTENHPRLVANLDDERLAALAAELQLPASALDVMSIGWWPDRRWWNQETQQREGESGCWTFPEYDAQGRIIGLGLRWPAGHKGQLAGGRRGLSLTTDWRDLPDPVLVAEGPTDVLAGRCVGLNCIGRPNNSGGTDLLAHACRNRQVIVIGENDRKSDGRWPGKEGAESVAHRLEAAWGRPVPVAYPPTGIKDVRAWVLELGGGAADADASAIRATILNALQPPALVWLVGPRTKQGRVSVKVFRWADGPDAAPIHSDRLNPDQESDRKRFAKALAKVEPQTDIDQIAQRLVALNIPPNDGENSRRKPSARVRHAAATDVVDKDLPVVLLPGGPVPIQESAEQLGKLLAPSKRYFVRGGAIVTVAHDEAGQHILDTVKPAALASVFETVANLMTLGKSGGETVQQPAVCTEQQAKLIEYCETFQRALPPLRLLSACPVLIERNGSLVQICGYDCDSGIMALAAPADDVPLDEAVELLSELLSEFRFATAADRARAFAAIITPALVMGGLLGGRAPVDLGEADASQTGKGYRNKLTAAIYGQTVRTVTQKKGGVGSLEETFSTALIRGRNFIALDNVRGQIDSPAIESFLTEDSFLARAPHQAAVEIDPRRVIVCMTSNRAEITIDMANRSSCVRIQKQPDGYRFREYPEGDILDHVRANQPRYLGAVFAVVRAWHEAGKPRTDETAHDFRPWARTLDWIAQNILDAGPLLDGHRETQMRMATPVLNWLRDRRLAVRDAAQMDIWLRAAQLVEVLVASAVDLPGLAEGGDMEDTEVRKKVLQAVGRRLGQCFRRENIVLIDGFEIERREDTDDEQRRTIREYRFRLRNPGPDECAYAPGPDGGRIGANPTSGGSEGNLEAPEDADSGLDAPVCAYGAPMVPLCVRLRNPAVALLRLWVTS